MDEDNALLATFEARDAAGYARAKTAPARRAAKSAILDALVSGVSPLAMRQHRDAAPPMAPFMIEFAQALRMVEPTMVGELVTHADACQAELHGQELKLARRTHAAQCIAAFGGAVLHVAAILAVTAAAIMGSFAYEVLAFAVWISLIAGCTLTQALRERSESPKLGFDPNRGGRHGRV